MRSSRLILLQFSFKSSHSQIPKHVSVIRANTSHASIALAVTPTYNTFRNSHVQYILSFGLQQDTVIFIFLDTFFSHRNEELSYLVTEISFASVHIARNTGCGAAGWSRTRHAALLTRSH